MASVCFLENHDMLHLHVFKKLSSFQGDSLGYGADGTQLSSHSVQKHGVYLGSAAAEKFAQIWGDSVTSVASCDDKEWGRWKDGKIKRCTNAYLQRANRLAFWKASYKYLVLRCCWWEGNSANSWDVLERGNICGIKVPSSTMIFFGGSRKFLRTLYVKLGCSVGRYVLWT